MAGKRARGGTRVCMMGNPSGHRRLCFVRECAYFYILDFCECFFFLIIILIISIYSLFCGSRRPVTFFFGGGGPSFLRVSGESGVDTDCERSARFSPHLAFSPASRTHLSPSATALGHGAGRGESARSSSRGDYRHVGNNRPSTWGLAAKGGLRFSVVRSFEELGDEWPQCWWRVLLLCGFCHSCYWGRVVPVLVACFACAYCPGQPQGISVCVNVRVDWGRCVG